jgi:hypothetical protein
VTGGYAPYTWSLVSGSAGLPNGLTLSASGVISGVPTAQGTYDFTVQVTDYGQSMVQKPLVLTVGP